MRPVSYAIGTMYAFVRTNRRKEAIMSNTLRARVKGGMLELLEKVDLPEGTEVMVTILHTPSSEDREAFRRTAGGWKNTVDADALIQNIYVDRLISTRPAP